MWDLDHVVKTTEWSLKLLDSNDVRDFPFVDQLLKYDSGTLVICQDLNRLRVGHLNFDTSMGKSMDKVREHLPLVFHRYLKGEPCV